MAEAEERRAIHAYLTTVNHERWHGQADSNGVSLSGLLEAMGEDLVHNPVDATIIQRARAIDAARRRRI